MDKHKVIEAYRRGLITLQECGQILGAEKTQVDDLVRADHSFAVRFLRILCFWLIITKLDVTADASPKREAFCLDSESFPLLYFLGVIGMIL